MHENDFVNYTYKQVWVNNTSADGLDTGTSADV